MNIQTRLVVLGVGFGFVFALGFWLSRAGKPYPTLIFSVHKLVTLGLIILLGLTVSRVHQTMPLSTAQILVATLTGACFLANMATGGMLSVDKTMPPVVHRLHQVTPYLTVISTAALLYLLLARNSLAATG